MAARNKDQRSDQDGGLSSSSNPTSLFKMSKLETEGLIHSAFKLTRHSRTQDLNTQLDTVMEEGQGRTGPSLTLSATALLRIMS